MTIKVQKATGEWVDFEVSDLWPHMDDEERYRILDVAFRNTNGFINWYQWLPQESYAQLQDFGL